MFIPLEFLFIGFFLYTGVLYLIWKEHREMIKFTDKTLEELIEVRGKNLDLRTHNEVLQTRNNLLSGNTSPGSIFAEDTMNAFDKTIPQHGDGPTLNSLAEEITSIKKMLDEKLGRF